MLQSVDQKADFHPYAGILTNSIRWMGRSSLVTLKFKAAAKWTAARLNQAKRVWQKGNRMAKKKE